MTFSRPHKGVYGCHLQGTNFYLKLQASVEIYWKILYDGTEITGCSLQNDFNKNFVNIPGTVGSLNSSVLSNKINKDSIFLDPVVEREVSSVILQLKNSASCEAGGIGIRPVKRVVLLIALSISYIFNISLPTSVFWKRMKIAMIFITP